MKRIIVILSMLILALTGCDDNTKEQTAPKENEEGVKKYDLVYAEVLNNGDDESMSMEVGYKNGNKLESKRYDTENVTEHILKDEKAKPYALIKEKEVHIFRHPYIIFDNEGEFDAKVDNKSVVK
ncbi:hypothetical protein [Macrococcus capreoli]|uniref:hypothetical protein n=1 Tax=Macrococcus capreoli TaxID=2982690 RepID=UPI0021D5AD0C|nr:hypothetical protein [Macrococcus sp. TMW 2.2395]MCU7556885.1 hypothetical protein [Macrococcus sp. TMW 2.2395]